MQSPTGSPAPSLTTSLTTGLTPSPAARVATASTLVRSGAISAALVELHAIAEDRVTRRELSDLDNARLLALLVDCRLARGDLADAITLGEEIVGCVDLGGVCAALAHHARGDLAAALGDPELAKEHFLAAGNALAGPSDPDQPGAPTSDMLPWRASAALVMLRTGSGRLAFTLAVEQHQIAVREGSAYAVANALRILAAADAGGQRVLLLREARAALSGVRAERLAAQIDTDLAGLLMLTNDVPARAEAVRLLRSAEDYAGRQELWPLQGRVRRLLDHCGEAPQRVTSEALAVLTTTERRVARLAADGLTNRQIAEQLLVSIKAVEWHLSRTYRKLGISSRTGLALTFGVPA